MNIEGTTKAFFKNGVNKVLWAITEKTDVDPQLFNIINGDILKIYDGDKIIWEGTIDIIEHTHSIYGFDVCGIQKNMLPEIWFDLFHNEHNALLIRKEI